MTTSTVLRACRPLVNRTRSLQLHHKAFSSNSSSGRSSPNNTNTDINASWNKEDSNRLIKAFHALNNYSVSGIMKQWSPVEETSKCCYDNAMVSPPDIGRADIQESMVKIVKQLKEGNLQFKINRVIEGVGTCISNDKDGGDSNHCIVEWTPVPDDGREGVHVCHFDKEGFIQHVVVYVRNRYE